MKNKIVPIQQNQVSGKINLANSILCSKLNHVNLESLSISEYNKRYLGDKLTNIKGVLQLYGRLISLSLKNHRDTLDNFTLVDYGGGSGLISLLAKELGIGNVIYVDIYDVSCKDIQCLSNELGLTLDHIVNGDVDELIQYLQVNSIKISAIVSYDVLEHIYDVEGHFKKLGSLNGYTFRVVYASGANIENSRYVSSIRIKQINAEYINRERKYGHKERDTNQSYLNIRESIISSYAPELDQGLVKQLASSTRGLIQKDIEICVNEFRRTGNIVYNINHPTNTCDPYTGNWCEHLIEFSWLDQIVTKAGFSVKIIPGYCTVRKTFLGNIKKLIRNALIQLLGRKGMIIAPYYVVYAELVSLGGSHDARD